MANNFNTPHCRALWNFEPGALGVDSRGLNPDLTPMSPPAPTADALCKEGASSLLLTRASKQSLNALDKDLPAGHPLKSDNATKTMTICFWARIASYPTSGQIFQVLCKSMATVDSCLELQLVYYTASTVRLTVIWGYGTTQYSFTPAISLSKDVWYHFSVKIDGTAAKVLKVRIYPDGGAAATYTGTPASELHMSTERLVIGANGTWANHFDGRLDELLVFNAVLSDAECDSVRQGTFDFGDARLVSRHRFEAGALTTDSKGTTTLRVPGVYSDAADFRHGAGSLLLTGGSYLKIPDASLGPLFPWKVGDAWKNGSIVGWYKFEANRTGALFGKWLVAGYGVPRLFLGTNGNLWYTTGASATSAYTYDTSIPILKDRWYYVAMSFDARNVNNSYAWFQIYVYDSVADSVLVYGPTQSIWCGYVGTGDFAVGDSGDGTGPMLGKIDQLAVYDEWLFLPEVEQLRKDEYFGKNNILPDLGLKAYWDFEDVPGSLVDEKGGCALTAYPGVTTSGASGMYRKSWEKGLVLDRDGGAEKYLSITDANLSAGYPLKSGDAVKLQTITMWVKPMTFMPNQKRYLYAKTGASLSARSFYLYLSDSRLYLGWVKSGDGYTVTERNTGIDLLPGEWYHIGCALDGVAKQLHLQVYRASTGQTAYDIVIAPNYMPYAINASAGDVRLGNQSYSGFDWANFDGLLDEVAVFAAKLTPEQLDSIRAGTFDFGAEASCKALWLMEPGALTADSKSTNTLTNVGSAASSADCVRGTGSVRIESTNNPMLAVRDENLPEGFPLKFGANTEKFAWCGWVMAKNFTGTGDQWLWTKGQLNQFTFGVKLYSVSINSYVQVHWGWGGGIEVYQSPNVYPFDLRWYHIGLSVDVAAQTCYVRVYDQSMKSVKVDYTHTFTNPLWVGAAPLWIGNSNAVDQNFDGVMDEMQFFNRSLSSEELELLQSRSFTPLDMQKVHHVSLYYEYGPPDIPLKRVFPVPHPRQRQQSQMGRRIFPVIH